MLCRGFLLFSFFLAATILNAGEITFPSDLLRHSAEVLELRNLDTIPEGISIMNDARYGNLRITKHRGVVLHLGRQLFDSCLYGIGEIPVLDYLEFAALDQKAHISDNPFLYRTLEFLSGDWAMLDSVSPSTPCRVESRDNLHYVVSWKVPQGDLIVTIPVDYNHLELMSRQEIEYLFLDQMSSFDSSGRSNTPLPMNDMQVDSRGVYTLSGQNYILSSINSNQYYQRGNDGNYALICDTTFPAETMANLVNARSVSLHDVTMDVRFDIYDSKTYRHQLTLFDFLSFCERQGCQPFWGHETVVGTEVNGTIFLYNGKAGYNHVVHVHADIEKVLKSSAAIEARAVLFVPVHNIDNFIKE